MRNRVRAAEKVMLDYDGDVEIVLIEIDGARKVLGDFRVKANRAELV